MNAVYVFLALSVLLLLGKAVRLRISLLQQLYLPSSVIGGIIGLVGLTLWREKLPAELVPTMSAVPGFLINVVFATLFLGSEVPQLRKVVSLAFPQLVLGQIMAWGQYVVGLALAGFVLSRWCNVPAAFGNLLEIGFEGGHGTVGGMAESFRAFGWEDGIALGFTVATAGMVIGIVAGVAMINWAHRRSIVKEVVRFDSRRFHERRGLYLRSCRPSAGVQTVMCDSIDSLAWHLAVVGASIGIGAALHALIPLKGFPLFPLCMIGGIILQALHKLWRQDMLVDRVQMERISGAALDFLVVSAMATIRIEVVANNWLALLILITSGAAWSIFVVLFFGPRVFKVAWFERSIADFGQATGVTATGLMLLRTVDPENKTCAAASFGYKQLLHEPIMGGGLWTALAFSLVYQWGWLNVLILSSIMLAFWIILAALLNRSRFSGGR